MNQRSPKWLPVLNAQFQRVHPAVQITNNQMMSIFVYVVVPITITNIVSNSMMVEIHIF
jgi:hypothetical protein